MDDIALLHQRQLAESEVLPSDVDSSLVSSMASTASTSDKKFAKAGCGGLCNSELNPKTKKLKGAGSGKMK